MWRRTLILVVLVSFCLLWACSMPDEPQLPQWDISLTSIPMMGPDTLVVGEEITDENLITDNDSLYHLYFEGYDQIDITDELKQHPISPDPFVGEIGTFMMNRDISKNVQINIFEAFSDLQPYEGMSAPIPAASFNVPPKNILIEDYKSATIESGFAIFTVTNNLNFPLGQPIRAALYDIDNADTVGVAILKETIPANGGTGSERINLANKTISNNLQIIISGQHSGTGTSAVLISNDQEFQVSLSITDLQVRSTTGKIPNQTVTISQMIDVSTDEFTLYSAKVSTGSMRLTFSHEFQFPVHLDLLLPEVVDIYGTPLHKTLTIQPGAPNSVDVDISNSSMALKNGRISFQVDATLLTDPNNFETISSTDKITASVSLSEIIFTEITADINIQADFPSFVEDVIDPDFEIPDIEFKEVYFTFIFDNNPVDMLLNIHFDGYKNSTIAASADYSFPVAGGKTNIVELSHTGVKVNDVIIGTSSGIENIVNLMPEKISVSGSAQIQDTKATVGSDPINIKYMIDVPAIYNLPANATMDGDTVELDMDKDIRDVITNIRDAKLEATLANGLPIGGHLYFKVADSTTAKTVSKQEWPTLTSIEFSPALTNEDGVVIEVPDQNLLLDISAEQTELLASADFLFWYVELDPMAKAQLKSTDMVIMRKLHLTGTLRINEDLFEEDDGS